MTMNDLGTEFLCSSDTGTTEGRKSSGTNEQNDNWQLLN